MNFENLQKISQGSGAQIYKVKLPNEKQYKCLKFVPHNQEKNSSHNQISINKFSFSLQQQKTNQFLSSQDIVIQEKEFLNYQQNEENNYLNQKQYQSLQNFSSDTYIEDQIEESQFIGNSASTFYDLNNTQTFDNFQAENQNETIQKKQQQISSIQNLINDYEQDGETNYLYPDFRFQSDQQNDHQFQNLNQQQQLFFQNQSQTQQLNRTQQINNNNQQYLNFESQNQFDIMNCCNKFCQLLKNEINISSIIHQKDKTFLSLPISFQYNSPSLDNSYQKGCLYITELAGKEVKLPKNQKQKKIKSLKNNSSYQGEILDLYHLSHCFQNELCDFEIIKNIFYQVLLGLETVHGYKISHNDIKMENILVFDYDMAQKKVQVKLSDFGQAYQGHRTVQEQYFAYKQYDNEFYPPELNYLIQNPNSVESPIDETKYDIFALGIAIYEIYSNGLSIYKQDDKQQQYYNSFLQNKQRFFNLYNNQQVNQVKKYEKSQPQEKVIEFYDLIKKMVNPDPKLRISASDAIEHPFFAQMNQS
ncbi:Protein kinase-like domain [Pseudocohnilembus persalinus]|uniref:Protein kinase-like domain n=1 Tax=Pseudocohnilembus persalinus TaxID=266149 RepID=A0A0V0QYC0_PSEPJ|nr:Protein kinase-like domain [Pseudocohnilembus persalinus]|eukprot:KRX07347.1 Protein kinase-like domain [Pseudocohnilembus persalinus]